MKSFLLFAVVALFLVISFSASAILVDVANDEASKQLANSLGFLGRGAGWDVEGGTRYLAGSATLVCNNVQNGAWILTAGHVATRGTTGLTFNILRFTFEPSYFDAFPRGTTSYLAGKCITAIHDKVFYHAIQDVALIKLEHLVYDSTGELVTPISFYYGSLSNKIILFGGAGETGIPSQADPNGTGDFDGYKRCARGVYDFLMGSEGVMNFSRSVPIPGIGINGDSGGFAAIEVDGEVKQCGVLVMLYGSGESADTSFEYLGYEPGFFDWMNNLIQENSNITTPTPTPTITATPTPTPTEHESAVAAWDIYQ
ncbi:MAG: hypothetical protein IT292_01390 [Deltaproteobacteria bacterium]|nr:hypothetical protein [Deltaproteobacteria bacterium]